MNSNINFYRETVCEVINYLFKYTGVVVSTEDLDAPLTGEKLGFDGIALMYLYMALEKRFQVKFNLQTSDIRSFYTINSISKLLSVTVNNH